MNWLEISLSVDSELADAIADVLRRHIQQGVATEFQIDEERQEARSGQVIVRGYLPIDGSETQHRARIEEDLWHLRQIQHFPEAAYQRVQNQDWTDLWRQHYRPMPIGERLLLVPAWYEPVEHSRQALILEPGMAFGTGTHPTTRVCVQAIEDYIQTGDRVYDIGCGTGILSIASLLLGASEVVAMDIDPAAIHSTEENAQRNQVLERITLIPGSFEDLISARPQGLQSGDLVVANILAKVLRTMLGDGLTRLLSPGATLILSGILSAQIDDILNSIPEDDLQLVEVRGEADWRAMIFKKKELPPRRGSSVL